MESGGAIVAVERWEGSGDEWNRFVRSDPASTFCHLYEWAEVMGRVLGHSLHYRAARGRDGALVGVLPLVEVKSRIFGHYLLSMPFLNYGGPLGAPDVRKLLAEAAVGLGSDLGVDLLELRSREEVPGPLEVAHRKITVVLDLPGDPEALWSKIGSKVRNQVRRPQKAGFVPRIGPDQLTPFYEVFSRNMRDLGTPVLSRTFFQSLVALFPDQVVFCAIHDGGQPVAAGCGFVHGAEFEMTWASSLREYSAEAPNMLLYWSCMEDMIRRRLSRFNFGRSTPDTGTHRFKRQWGGSDVPLPWSQWSESGVSATPSPDSPLFRTATAVWQRLPLWLTNHIGPLVSRQIP